jgi:annexin A7/11
MHGAKSKHDGQGFWRDAKLIEKSMAGLGTRDTQLIYRLVPLIVCFCFCFTDKDLILLYRLVRAHWDPNRLEAIKDAYRRRYGKPLEGRVKGETSGDYQKLLVAIVKSSETRRV